MDITKFNTPTASRIIELKPEGSIITIKEIKDLYCEISKTEKRQKLSSNSKKSGVSRSPRCTKRKRGGNLYRTLVKEGFWKTK